MKKAKDYAKIINDNPTPETLAKVANDFIFECKELVTTRNAQTDSAAVAIFREQDQKWRAVCNRVEGLKPEGFRLLVGMQFPEVARALGWAG